MYGTIVLCCGFLAEIASDGVLAPYGFARREAGCSARKHLDLGLWCGAQGLEAKRNRHLLIALLIDPDNALARGLLGFVWNAQRWERVPSSTRQGLSASALAAARARHRQRLARAPQTAEAHWQLALWCEREGLASETLAHAATVVRLDPTHDLAWKRLGFIKSGERRVTRAQFVAEGVARLVQARADRDWLARITAWRKRLSHPSRRAAALQSLLDTTEPRAVPSIWRTLGTGNAAEQAIAAQVLGSIDSRHAARALAMLAVFGRAADVRRSATEMLSRRDPSEYADLLIGLLREPLKYDTKAVGGPGMPGMLTVYGHDVILQRVYAPPPPPELPIFPGEKLSFDAQGLPIIDRHTDTTNLPFVWYSATSGWIFPTFYVIPPHSPVRIHLGRIWLENWKSASMAQQQLEDDADFVERVNDEIRAANEHVARLLTQATGKTLPADRAAWSSWLTGRTPRRAAARKPLLPTLVELVPLNYLPRSVVGLAFDPVIGYYVLAPTFGW